ncbi:hypothetical protein IVA96_24950 [Bradyrhizobium sp. 159]|uniref:hypothetical protein n=1 Tax=unclassified Bradyrhizobium TaxID=2631580 RepID=UPI001FFB1036|nr:MULTISPECIES: hypothetical protein [unclassified Bradyrhizobium]MCK1619762.1 hypothetical protein [Bradyrhizobium sp. 159]MCK1664669.1 hypothetical protein [Bradyrhizobium sp. 153]
MARPPEKIGIFRRMFRRAGHDETILTKDETIFRFWRITHETTHGYQLHNDGTAGHRFGDKTMRALSFILAFGFVLAGSSFAGSPDGSLPGVGTFQYTGSSLTIIAPQPIVVATRF